MKITLNIEDATPEEFARLFGGLQTERPVHVASLNHKVRIQNLKATPWAMEELDAIRGCRSGADAIQVYRQKFQSSPRSRSAVERQWSKVHNEQAPARKVPDPASIEETGCLWCKEPLPSDKCDKCSPPLKKEPVMPKGKASKYGIPSSLLKNDKKLYDRLQKRCKAHGLTYEQALAQEGTMKRGKRPAKPAALQNVPEKKPRKSPVTKERLPFHQTQTGSAASSGTNPQIITSGMPASQTIYQSNAPSLHGLQLKAGDKVRHNGSKASPHFGHVGEILKVEENGQVFVKFGETSTWLSPHLVAVVPGVA